MPDPRIDKELLSTKHQIEAELHAKLEAARIEYESASEAYQEALKRCDELAPIRLNENGNGKPHSARQSATEAVSDQRHAFEKYRRALDDFNKFILYGDLPVWP